MRFWFFICLVLSRASAGVTFDQALSEVVRRHSGVAVQETKVRQADEAAFASKMNYLPHFSIDGSEQISNVPPTSAYGLGVTARLNLFRGGADAAAVNASESDLEYQRGLLSDSLLKAEAEGVIALVNFISRAQEVQALARQAKAFEGYVTVAQQRYDQGLLASQELDKIRIDRSNIDARLQDSETQLTSARAEVQKLLGHSDVVVQWPWKDALLSHGSRLLNERFEPISRPDYRAAKSFAEAEEERVRQTFGKTIPAIDLVANQTANFQSGQNVSNITTLSISIPFFDAFQDRASYKSQVENQNSAEIKLRQLQIDVKTEWEKARENLKTSLKTAEARSSTLAIAEKLYKANTVRFKQGRASANDVQVDQTRVTDAELLEIQGWSNAHLSFMKFCQALGRSVSNCEK